MPNICFTTYIVLKCTPGVNLVTAVAVMVMVTMIVTKAIRPLEFEMDFLLVTRL